MRTPIYKPYKPAASDLAATLSETAARRWRAAFAAGVAGNHARADQFATGPAPLFGREADVARYGSLLVVAVRAMPWGDTCDEGGLVSVEVVDCGTVPAAEDAFADMSGRLFCPAF